MSRCDILGRISDSGPSSREICALRHFCQSCRMVIESAAERLLELPESQSEAYPAPGKWSAKEVLGHLIDSAANNHRRFVRAQLREDLAFPGYDQDHWVAVQQYQKASWPLLIALWKSYNLHLLHVVSSMPEETLTKKRRVHTFHRIAWQTVSEDTPVTLEYLIRDYFGHLIHHLKQILGEEVSLGS